MDLAAIRSNPRLRRLVRRRAAYRTVFQGPDGEVVLRDLMRFCGVAQTSHVPGDPAGTAFNEGQRRVALRIAGFLNMADERLLAFGQTTEEQDD